MKLLESFFKIVAPDCCISCGQEGKLICDDCAQVSFDAMPRCYRCKKPDPNSLTCLKCSKNSPLNAVYVAASYKNLAKDLVHACKYQSSRSAARIMSEQISVALPYLDPEQTIITHSPTTPSRIRERSFDQSGIIAKNIAIKLHLLKANLLVRMTNTHQVGATHKQRIAHMDGAFEVKNPILFKGKTVLLVDDVLTTGATLESAARTLRRSGAKRVIACVFARTE